MSDYNSSPCVGSGLCCQKAPCAYGFWSEEKNSCGFLEVSYKDEEKKIEIFHCGNYEEIKKQPGSDMMPAFGAGCCMGLFNTGRNNIIKEFNNGNKKVIEIISQRL